MKILCIDILDYFYRTVNIRLPRVCFLYRFNHNSLILLATVVFWEFSTKKRHTYNYYQRTIKEMVLLGEETNRLIKYVYFIITFGLVNCTFTSWDLTSLKYFLGLCCINSIGRQCWRI